MDQDSIIQSALGITAAHVGLKWAESTHRRTVQILLLEIINKGLYEGSSILTSQFKVKFITSKPQLHLNRDRWKPLEQVQTIGFWCSLQRTTAIRTRSKVALSHINWYTARLRAFTTRARRNLHNTDPLAFSGQKLTSRSRKPPQGNLPGVTLFWCGSANRSPLKV